MSRKRVIGKIKLQVKGGSATPGPPVGAKLGSKGIKAMDFCTRFNALTQDRKGQLLPVILSIYQDKTFDFIIKNPPAALLIKQAVNLEKGSAEPNRKKVATITKEQLKEIAMIKQEDTNAFDLAATIKIMAGTARSMGVKVISNQVK